MAARLTFAAPAAAGRFGRFDALAVAISLISYWYTLQRYGIYDYFDGMRYLASGVSLLVDRSAAPIPISYVPSVNAVDFVNQDFLSYPSILFQLWTGVTTGAGSLPLLATSLFSATFYVVHNVAFIRLARLYLPDTLALAGLLAICFVPSVFHRTMTRPLPDGFLSMTYTLSIYLAAINRTKLAGMIAAIGSVVRFQGLLFSWGALLFASGRRAIVAGVVAFSVSVAGALLLISLLSSALGPRGPSNFDFYLKRLSPNDLLGLAGKLPEQSATTFSALMAHPEFIFFLISLPFVLIVALFSSTYSERKFSILAAISAFHISFISFLAMTVTIGGGYDGRYLMYFIPPLFIADLLAIDFLLRRLPFLRKVSNITVLVLFMSLSFVYCYYFLLGDPFWKRNYLPDQGLAVIPPNAIVAVAGAGEAASEIYTVSKARSQMWLPQNSKEFLKASNPHVDFIVIGGYWGLESFEGWDKLSKLEQFVDGGGYSFSLVTRTTYYAVFAKAAN